MIGNTTFKNFERIPVIFVICFVQMQEKIESQYSEKLQNVYSLYDQLCDELVPGNSSNCMEDQDGEYEYDTYL